MKPYPLSALNHFTVPVAIDETPPPLLRNGQRRRRVRIRYSLGSTGRVALNSGGGGRSTRRSVARSADTRSARGRDEAACCSADSSTGVCTADEGRLPRGAPACDREAGPADCGGARARDEEQAR